MRDFLCKYLRGPKVNFKSLVAQHFYERVINASTPQELFEIAQELGLAKGTTFQANYLYEQNLLQNNGACPQW